MNERGADLHDDWNGKKIYKTELFIPSEVNFLDSLSLDFKPDVTVNMRKVTDLMLSLVNEYYAYNN